SSVGNLKFDKSSVGSNKPKSATSREARFSSITSSSAAFSITNASSSVWIISGGGRVAAGGVGLGKGSRDSSDACPIVGLSASLLISNWEAGFVISGSGSVRATKGSGISSSSTANSSRL